MAGVRLIPVTQNYAWGRRGLDSKVSVLLNAGGYLDEVDEKAPYAELWMGTHPKGPAQVDLSDGVVPLLTFLKGKPLPYLFKVLSVNQSLSIQAHPDKALARQLHKERPDVYKDDNHKPEMALALTNFQAMCGFRPYEDIADFLVSEPEFSRVAGKGGQALIDAVKKESGFVMALKEAFSAVMQAEKREVLKLVRELVERMRKQTGEQLDVHSLELPHLIQRLNIEYPGDVGIFCVYFLNVLELKPGEAVFLEANLPHAYLFGDCLECMAQSDNVVRAGLTPKLRDTKVLCEMLNYKCAGQPKVMCGTSSPNAETCVMYRAPIDEFALEVSTFPKGSKGEIPMNNNIAPSIILILAGSGEIAGRKVKTGEVLLFQEGKGTPLPVLAGGIELLQVARCHAI